MKYLNYNIDMRNSQVKNFIINQNGLEKLQQELNKNPKYIKSYKQRQTQKRYYSKVSVIKQEQKKLEEKIKRDKRVLQEIKNFIADNNDLILGLREPEGVFKLFPLTFGEEYKILFLSLIFDRIRQVLNFNDNKDKIITDVNINDVYYTLHEQTINTLIDKFNKNVIEQNFTSDITMYFYNYINEEEPIIFISKLKTNKYDKKEGAFFKYYNNTNINLERYQISNGNNALINKDNCLIHVLKLYNITDDKIEIVKKYVNNGNIPICKLNDICDEIGIKINLITNKKTQGNNKSLKLIYGKEGEVYNICCLDGHYFIYDKKTDYTSFYIKNYNLLKNVNETNKNHIYKIVNNKYYEKNNKFVIDSFKLINLFLEYKEELLIKIDYTNINLADELNKNFIINEEDNKFNDLYYDTEYSTKGFNIGEEKTQEEEEINKNLDIVIFDFETYNDNNLHIPYLCCCIDENNNESTFHGINCGEQLLKSLKKDTILMAHNAKYDRTFIIKYLRNCREINNGSSFITFSGYYNKLKIIIKDSYKLITCKLSEMPEMFLNEDKIKEIKKEVMPYKIYNKFTVIKRYIEIEEINKKFRTEEERNIFLENAKNWDLFYNNKVDIIKYSEIYCKMDCKILKECYKVFREWCLKDFNLDINNILTIPSLAEKYFKNCGCFDGCYSLCGLPQLFISQSVVGGRTMMKDNKKDKILNEILNDFDAVSLYPSAMSRIDGFLKGKPKLLKNNQLSYDIIKSFDGYFVQIKIISIGIKRAFPLMSYKNEEGVRDFNNEMEGKLLIVDKTTLEDLIMFQKIEFEILKGYYFDEGFNYKIVETINYLFKKRKDLKKNNNKSEVIYKLIMNAGYGKLITKPHDTNIIFFDNEKNFNIYRSRNYNIIKSYTEYVKGKFRVEINNITGNQYNYCHLGSSILSMSKRIMNEVICTAEDNNLNIYYQDTDSIHINDKDIKELEKIYKNKYNRDLIGKNMGQFHSDFKLKVEGVKEIKNIVSTGLIMLGKKSYIDRLRGEDEQGNYHFGYHIRLKGINEEAINLKVKENYKDAFELYNDLYNGKKITFDLTDDEWKPCFEFDKSYNITSRTEFKRVISF